MPFYKQGDIGAIQRVADQRNPNKLKEAQILTILPSGRMSVQLRGSNQSIIVETADSSKYKAGQQVTLMRSASMANKWVVLSAYNATGGNATFVNNLSPGSQDPLSPPKSIVVTPTVNQVTLQWSPSGPRNDITYEIQVSSDNPQVTILSTTQISGSTFTYAVPTGTVYYFAVRAVDSNWNRSSWSTVVAGTGVYATGIGADYTFDVTFPAPGTTTPLPCSADTGIKAISYITITQSSGMFGTFRVYIGSTDLITTDETDASYIGAIGYNTNYRSTTGHQLMIDLSGVTGSGTISMKVTVNP